MKTFIIIVCLLLAAFSGYLLNSAINTLKEEEIILEVIDNGMGMPKEKVEHLLTDGVYERKHGSGIGLKNVDQRIKLYFGNEYGLIIKSEPDVGTHVTIRLPIKKEIDHHEAGR